MRASRLAAADNQRYLQEAQFLQYLAVVQRVLVNVNSAPQAGIVLVDGNDAYACLAAEMGFVGGKGPWFVDELVDALLLSPSVLGCKIQGTVGSVQATEQPRKSFCFFFHSIKERPLNDRGPFRGLCFGA